MHVRKEVLYFRGSEIANRIAGGHMSFESM
jgi:hypothetical protein